jgi:hypothetical protein
VLVALEPVSYTYLYQKVTNPYRHGDQQQAALVTTKSVDVDGGVFALLVSW